MTDWHDAPLPPTLCWFCDPYTYPWKNEGGIIPAVCNGHASLVNTHAIFFGLPPGQLASWKRGVWT